MNKIIKKLTVLMTLVVLATSLVACGGKKEVANEKFPDFTAKDFQGNTVSQDIFKENSVTVVNVWFTGCKACIQEMPQLEKISNDLKAKGVGFVGICVDAEDPSLKAEGEKILKQAGVTYPNLITDHSEAIDKYLNGIVAFPTTLFVDKEGNIVGEPMVGSIDGQKGIDDLNKRVDEILAKENK